MNLYLERSNISNNSMLEENDGQEKEVVWICNCNNLYNIKLNFFLIAFI